MAAPMELDLGGGIRGQAMSAPKAYAVRGFLIPVPAHQLLRPLVFANSHGRHNTPALANPAAVAGVIGVMMGYDQAGDRSSAQGTRPGGLDLLTNLGEREPAVDHRPPVFIPQQPEIDRPQAKGQ